LHGVWSGDQRAIEEEHAEEEENKEEAERRVNPTNSMRCLKCSNRL